MNEIVPRTVAVYMRTSSDEQAKNETIEIQRNYLAMYVELHQHTVYKWYSDDGVTGTLPLGDRPAGRELLRDAKLGLFSAVLVYKIDRFGRKMLVILDAHEELERAGVAFVSARESGIETTTSTGRAFFQLMGVFAELERSTILERMTGGKSKKARSGQWVTGRVPYGYEVVDGQLFPSAAQVGKTTEAELVRLMYALVADGRTTYEVAKYVNEHGYARRQSRYGNGTLAGASAGAWSVQTITALIRNPVYRGQYIFRSRMRKAKLVGDPIQMDVPPLVLTELWIKANDRLTMNRKGGGPQRFRYLLKGVLRCGQCGYAYSGAGIMHGDQEYRYYHCSGKLHKVPGTDHVFCANPRLRAPDVEQAMLQAAERVIGDADEFLKLLPDIVPVDTAEQLAAKLAEVDRLNHIFMRGGMANAEYDRRKLELDQALTKLREPAVGKTRADIAAMVRSMPADLSAFEVGRQTVLALVEQAEVQPEAPRIKVRWIGGVEECLM